MSTILFGMAITLVIFIIIILAFRHRGGQGTASHPDAYFSTYDGGHDGLGQNGSDWGGREASHAGGSNDNGWGESGSGSDGGSDGGGNAGGGE